MKIALLACLLLLAGCTSPATQPSPPTGSDSTGAPTSGPGPGNGFAPQGGHAQATDPAAPGLNVTAEMRVCDAGFCIHAWAENNGPATYQVSNICAPPWNEAMKRDGKDVQHQESMAYCMAFGTGPMAPGAVLHANFTWDQRVWDDGKAAPAPEGAYTWTITFTAYDEAMGEGIHRIPVSFTVIVGET